MHYRPIHSSVIFPPAVRAMILFYGSRWLCAVSNSDPWQANGPTIDVQLSVPTERKDRRHVYGRNATDDRYVRANRTRDDLYEHFVVPPAWDNTAAANSVASFGRTRSIGRPFSATNLKTPSLQCRSARSDYYRIRLVYVTLARVTGLRATPPVRSDAAAAAHERIEKQGFAVGAGRVGTPKVSGACFIHLIRAHGYRTVVRRLAPTVAFAFFVSCRQTNSVPSFSVHASRGEGAFLSVSLCHSRKRSPQATLVFSARVPGTRTGH